MALPARKTPILLAFTAYGYAGNHNPPFLAFDGEHFDAASKSYILGQGYRGYSPSLMRFRSPDHWSPFGSGGINPYCFCSGDPINHFDPSGHAPLTPKPLKRLSRGVSFQDILNTSNASIMKTQKNVAMMHGQYRKMQHSPMLTETISAGQTRLQKTLSSDLSRINSMNKQLDQIDAWLNNAKIELKPRDAPLFTASISESSTTSTTLSRNLEPSYYSVNPYKFESGDHVVVRYEMLNPIRQAIRSGDLHKIMSIAIRGGGYDKLSTDPVPRA
jgi:RHS repeat-associated protein